MKKNINYNNKEYLSDSLDDGFFVFCSDVLMVDVCRSSKFSLKIKKNSEKADGVENIYHESIDLNDVFFIARKDIHLVDTQTPFSSGVIEYGDQNNYQVSVDSLLLSSISSESDSFSGTLKQAESTISLKPAKEDDYPIPSSEAANDTFIVDWVTAGSVAGLFAGFIGGAACWIYQRQTKDNDEIITEPTNESGKESVTDQSFSLDINTVSTDDVQPPQQAFLPTQPSVIEHISDDDKKADEEDDRNQASLIADNVVITEEAASTTIESIPDLATVVIQGQVMLGPVIASNDLSVEILSNDDRLLAKGPIDANGRYEVSIEKGLTIIKARVIDDDDAPDYLDEYTGEAKDLSATLLSVIVLENDGQPVVMHINPLTTLTSRLMGMDAEGHSQPLSIEAIKAANTQIAKVFFDDENIDIARHEIIPLIDKEGEVIEGNEGGNVLAMISALEEKQGLTTEQVIEQLSESFIWQEDTFVVNDKLTQLLQEGAVHLGNKLGSEVKDTLQKQVNKIEQVVSKNFSMTVDGVELTPVESVSDYQVLMIDEDTVYEFSAADFLFSGSNVEDKLQSITIHSLPDKGSFEFNGADVDVGAVIDSEHLNQLTYIAETDDHGSGYADIIFTVDDGELQSVGQGLTFDVQAINDSPVISVYSALDSLVGTTERINTVTEGDQSTPHLAPWLEEGFIAVWLDQEKSIKAQKFVHDKINNSRTVLVKEGGEFTIKASALAGFETYVNPMITTQTDGGFAVQWWHHDPDSWNEPKIRFLDRNNQDVSSESIIGSDYYTTSIATLLGGGTAVGFIKDGGGSYFGINLYNGSGDFVKTLNIAPAVGWGAGSIDITACKGGGFAASWRLSGTDDDHAGFSVYDANGDRVSVPVYFSSEHTDIERSSEIAALNDGSIITMYAKGNGIYVQRWEGSDNTLESTQKVITSYGFNSNSLDLVALDDDGFFILWESHDAIYDHKIQGQFFTSDGVAASDAIEIYSAESDVDIENISVIQLGNGLLQVVWSLEKNGDTDVFSTHINPAVLKKNISDATVVATASAFDVDSYDLSYSLVDDANGLFSINSVTGDISIVDTEGVTRSLNASFLLNIRVEDELGLNADINHQVAFEWLVNTGVSDDIYLVALQKDDLLALIQSGGNLEADGSTDDLDSLVLSELFESSDSLLVGGQVVNLLTTDDFIQAGLIEDNAEDSSTHHTYWSHPPDSDVSSSSLLLNLSDDQNFQENNTIIIQVIG